MSRNIVCFVMLIAFLFMCACAQTNFGKMDADPLLAKGNALFERGKLTKALEAYQTFSLNHPLHPQNSYVQYRIGECYYQMEDYQNAEFEYTELLRLYPDSPFIEEANFKLAKTFFYRSPRPALDQEMTETALLKFRSFVADFPGSDYVEEARSCQREMQAKLYEKKYLNAKTYYNLRSYSAAVMYLDEILMATVSETLLGKSYFLKANCLIQKGDLAAAQETLETLQQKLPQFKAEKVEQLMKEVQAAL